MALVVISEPRVAWAAEFRAIAATVRRVLGSLALRIDHIGSTSVPGLPAKDVIDLQVSVATLDPSVLVPPLLAVGFVPRPDIADDHCPPGAGGTAEDWAKLYFREPPGEREVHLHVRVLGRANTRYALLFRDYLRADPTAASAYAELKRRLAALGLDTETYADVKDPACDLIAQAAEFWARQSGWQPGPSDS